MRASLPLLPLLALGCSPPPVQPPPRSCVPACHKRSSCDALDARLVDARQPLLACVGREATRGELAEAHRCYRSLRLLESARWWLKTLTGQDELHSVYMPSDTVKMEFLCRIEALTRARTPQEVEVLYLDMIRAFP